MMTPQWMQFPAEREEVWHKGGLQGICLRSGTLGRVVAGGGISVQEC